MLPTSLRLASVVAIVVYDFGTAIILRRAGLPIRWISPGVARWGTWVLVVLLTLSAAGNLLSESSWERFLMAPTEQPELSTTAHS
jgi:hypothetical protein